MPERTCLTIILGAGEGTRMKSARPKVLHEIAGLPMLGHVVNAATAAGSDAIAVVVSGHAEQVSAMLANASPGAQIYKQTDRLGTAHAVLAARQAIEEGYDDLLVLFGDTPLVRPETLNLARRKIGEGFDIAVIGFQTANPAGYGRLIVKDGVLVAIREERDCDADERAITFCNGGLMAISGSRALALLGKIGNDNAKNEFYLTDIVSIAHSEGMGVTAIQAPFEELLGINNRTELAEAELIWQANRRRDAMMAGVTLQSPDSVFFSYDTELGQDCVIEPHVWFGPGVKIGTAARIRAFSHLEGTEIAENAQIGPFARLRPGAKLGKGSKVGNFCEVKQAEIGDNAKINHLTYIGDSKVGPGANIGAGTITCNYDGYNKYITEIGEGAFVGSNSALVAPVKIGKNVIIAAGSVITKNVPDDALAFGRARQTIMEGRAKALNALNAAKKKTTPGRADK